MNAEKIDSELTLAIRIVNRIYEQAKPYDLWERLEGDLESAIKSLDNALAEVRVVAAKSDGT